MIYTIYICPECGQRSYGKQWCFPCTYPDGPGGIKKPTVMCDTIEVVPRAVADELANAIAAELPLLREARDGRQTAVDEPLARYRKATSQE